MRLGVERCALDARPARRQASLQPLHRRHARLRPSPVLRPRGPRAHDARAARIEERPADGRAAHRQDELPPPPEERPARIVERRQRPPSPCSWISRRCRRRASSASSWRRRSKRSALPPATLARLRVRTARNGYAEEDFRHDLSCVIGALGTRAGQAFRLVLLIDEIDVLRGSSEPALDRWLAPLLREAPPELRLVVAGATTVRLGGGQGRGVRPRRAPAAHARATRRRS